MHSSFLTMPHVHITPTAAVDEFKCQSPTGPLASAQPCEHTTMALYIAQKRRRARRPDLLATALLDLPGGDEPIPWPWRRQFDTEQAEPSFYGGLFRTCPAGRDWALRTSPKLSVRLQVPSTEQPPPGPDSAAWQAQVTGVQRALQTRGALPTSLTLVGQKGQLCAAAWYLVPDTLQGSGAGVKALSLQGVTDPMVLTGLLQRAAVAFPSLTTLTMQGCVACLFPPAGSLPHLIHIHIIKPSQDIVPGLCRALASLTPQLRSLTLTRNKTEKEMDANPVAWSDIFRADNVFITASHLTELVTDEPVSDSLIAAVTACAPALRHIQARCFGSRSKVLKTNHSASEWGLQRLLTTAPLPWAEPTVLSRLPKPTHGRCEILASEGIRIEEDQVFNAAFMACMARYSIVTESILVQRDEFSELPPAALHEVLHELQALDAPGALIEVSGWVAADWEQQQTIDALSALSHLQLTIETDFTLTDELMTTLLTTLTHVRGLSVRDIGPLSQQYSDTVWPWDELAVTQATLAGVQRIPLPSTGRCPAKLRLSIAGPLTDELLAAVLQLGPVVRKLSAEGLRLQCDYSHMPCPWEELSLGCVEALQLLWLPSARHRESPCEIIEFSTLDLRGLTQFNCQGMRKWLFDNQDKWWLPKQTDKTFLLNVDWQGWHLFSEVRILEVQTSLVQALRHGCIDLVYVSEAIIPQDTAGKVGCKLLLWAIVLLMLQVFVSASLLQPAVPGGTTSVGLYADFAHCLVMVKCLLFCGLCALLRRHDRCMSALEKR